MHGFEVDYNVFRGAPETFISVRPIELTGKYTSECYFEPLIAEFVYSSMLISAIEDAYDTKPVVSEPSWLASLSLERVSADWATIGGKIGIQTSESLEFLEAEPDIFWLGVNLKNGQFY